MKKNISRDRLSMAAAGQAKERDYWLKKLSGEWIKSCFPYTYHSDVLDPGDVNRDYKFSSQLSSALVKLSGGSDVRLHIVLLAALNALLSRYITGVGTGIDIVVGAPILKSDKEADLINRLLVLKTTVKPNMTFKELLSATKQTVSEAVAHQNYPVEILAEQLGRSVFEGEDFPLFDIAVVMTNIHEMAALETVSYGITLEFYRETTVVGCNIRLSSSLYSAETVERIFDHYNRFLEKATADVNAPICDIEYLSPAERRKILVDFNTVGASYPTDTYLHNLFENQVSKNPSAVALKGMMPEPCAGTSNTSSPYFSYGELDEKARLLAQKLRQQGAKPGTVIALMTQRSMALIVGILAILKTGAVYLPINPKTPAKRVAFLLKDSCAVLMLGENDVREKTAGICQGIDLTDDALYISPDGATTDKSGLPRELPLKSESPAYIIYTSGSTGNPKGVSIRHCNIVPLILWGLEKYGIDYNDRAIQNLSYFFDWSVWEIFITLTSGASLYMITEDILLNTEAQANFIDKHCITVLHITPTQFGYMVDLGRRFETLKYLFIGAERSSYNLVRRTIDAVSEDCRVFNMYGPTETTIISSVQEIDKNDYKKYKQLSSIPIGETVANTKLSVLDNRLNPCPLGVEGELYIGGDSLAVGYLNDPVKTNAVFVKNSIPEIPGPLLYKTGDRVRWVSDGILEFLGRIDQQVKIRGYRIELGEIENQLLEHPDVNETIVIAAAYENGEKYLCAYFVPSDTAGIEYGSTQANEFRAYLSGQLPYYMIPDHFVPLEKMPLNPNGKIDLKALPKPADQENITAYVAPRDDVEETLAGIWMDVLKLERQDQDNPFIGIDDDFFRLGGHSLRATSIILRVYKELGVNLDVGDVFAQPTIRQLADKIKSCDNRDESFSGIETIEKREYYQLSSAQHRLFILRQLDPMGLSYNMPMAVCLEGELSLKNLNAVFQNLVNRHESFRTSFEIIDGETVQRIHEHVTFGIEEYSSDEAAVSGIIHTFIRSFDLSVVPLLRVALIQLTTPRQYILVVDMHHIISDGTSMGNLMREFMDLYAGHQLPPLQVQYKDFVYWQNRTTGPDSLQGKQQETWWLHQFQGDIPVLELPMDHTRTSTLGFPGDNRTFNLSSDQTASLKRLSGGGSITLFMILTAVYTLLLSKLSSHDDIVVGTPIAGRNHADLEPIIGMFVNSLALRNFPRANLTFVEFLADVQERTLQAFKNQDYQLEDLVEKVVVNRDSGRNPLFDTMLSLQNTDIPEICIPGLTLKPYSIGDRVSKFDLTLTGKEEGDQLFFRLQYRTDLFEDETIDRFTRYFKRLVDSVCDDPLEQLGHLEIISPSEKKQVLHDFNIAISDIPEKKTLQRLFEEKVEKYPGAAAVIGPEETEAASIVTYRYLNERANRIAHCLRKVGVTAGTIVALKIDRSIDMIFAIMGVLKAGGAYLPLGLDFPTERIRFILNDSGCRIMIGQSLHLNNDYEISDLRSIPIDQVDVHNNSADNTEHVNTAQYPAYLIYTSGTTGKPKGVVTRHYNVSRVVKNTNYLEITHKDRLLQLSNYAFDGSVFDIYGALLNGAALIMVHKDSVFDSQRMARIIKRKAVNLFFVTTALFNTLVDIDLTCLTGLRKVLFGGERASLPHVRTALAEMGKGKLIHVYGPTETTVYATAYSVDHISDDCDNLPIGKPLTGTTLYVLNDHMHLVPPGVVGTLFIGGHSTAAGYLNNPQLTVDKFVSNPFNPGEILYNSGDLVTWNHSGDILFYGRKDHQVKIRGFRIELEEIAAHISAVEGVDEAVVIDRKGPDGQKYLCAYIVLEDADSQTNIRAELVDVLPSYMIPSYIIPMSTIPLNPNGKIDRKALPEPALDAISEYEPPRDRVDEELTRVWSEVLGIESEKIGIGTDFFELGGHSLKATTLMSHMHKDMSVKVSLADIFANPSIRQLADYIKGLNKDIHRQIDPLDMRSYYDLSAAQRRLFMVHQMDAGGHAYNMPVPVILEGHLQYEKLRSVFQELIKRHESFRTSFHIIDDQPVQVIHPESEVPFEMDVDSGEDSVTEIEHRIEEFVKPFDLTTAPLFRINLTKIETDRHLLIVDMHHIISDGVSMNVFTKDFMAIYSGESLISLRIQYKDFAHWQNRFFASSQSIKQEEWWLEQLVGPIPLLTLPTDFPRPQIQQFSGNNILFEIDSEETAALKSFALEEKATLFMILTAVFNIWIAKLTGMDDIVLGTPAAGRNHVDLEPIIGMFVNTLVLRNRPEAHKNVSIFLRDVRNFLTAAFDNQDYPFEELVDKVDFTRDAGRNPLFDLMIDMHNTRDSRVQIPGLTLIPVEYDPGISKFDLTLNAVETDDILTFNAVYRRDLFKQATMERFVCYFKRIISSVVSDRNMKIGDIEIITEDEKKQILSDFNESDSRSEQSMFDAFKVVSQIFEDRVAQHSYSTAVVSDNHTLTYGGLNEQAGRLAKYLRENGVKPGTIVPLLVDRSVEMVVGIIGILKAGAAYLPLAVDLPSTRKAFIIKDCGATILLTLRSLHSLNSEGPQLDFLDKIVFLDDDISSEGMEKTSPDIIHHPTDPAYVIYTSGSTGEPKGVVVENRNLINLVTGLHQRIYKKYQEGINVALVAPYVFDASVKQIFAALLLGNRLNVVPEDARIDGAGLLEYYKKYRVDISDGTPAHLYLMVESSPSGNICIPVRHFLIGGEALSHNTAMTFFDRVSCCYQDEQIIITNIYGPTECCVDSTSFDITRNTTGSHAVIPIGRPMPRQQVYILDENFHLQPVGIPGQLCIGGRNVSRGYWKREELTAEKFAPNPFKSGERIYKTGDLARWLPDGNLEYIGRIDHQVKVRGFRIELGEIENRLSSHEYVKESLVVVKNSGGTDNYLCAYIVTDITSNLNDENVVSEDEVPTVDGDSLRKFLSGSLPDYMIPAFFVFISRMPLTANGKVDKRALPEPEMTLVSNYAPPNNAIEKKLLKIFHEILSGNNAHTGDAEPPFGIDDNFFQIGGHSLKATIMTSRIHREMGIKIPLTEIFRTNTVRGLASYIEGAGSSTFTSIPHAPSKDVYELSSAQKRLYLLYQANESDISYNMPYTFILEGEVSVDRLETVFQEMVLRHESFRTSFEMNAGRPVQRINKDVEFRIQKIAPGRISDQGRGENIAPGDVAQHMKQFVQPFDLISPPLLRVGILEFTKDKWLLMIDMHHIITDGTSIGVFAREFMALYAGETPPLPVITYKDFAEWSNSQEQQDALARQETFWLNQFTEPVQDLGLRTDYPRSNAIDLSGNSLNVLINETITRGINQLCQRNETTLFMTALAFVDILLAKLSGKEDIVVGTPVAGRNHDNLQNIIGMFVNTLVLRNNVSSEKTFSHFLAEVKERTLNALDNQDYPFEDLVENVLSSGSSTVTGGRKPSDARNPLFNVMFSIQNLDFPVLKIPGITLRQYEFGNPLKKFEIMISFSEVGDHLNVNIGYRTNLFKEETIRNYGDYLLEIIEAVVANSDIRLKDIPVAQMYVAAESKKQEIEFGF